jgi:hypothetical protein
MENFASTLFIIVPKIIIVRIFFAQQSILSTLATNNLFDQLRLINHPEI